MAASTGTWLPQQGCHFRRDLRPQARFHIWPTTGRLSEFSSHAVPIEVNGAKRSVDVDGETPLLWVLRDTLDLNGTKFGCGIGPMRRLHRASERRADPCLPDPHLDRHGKVTTIEGLGQKIGTRLQPAWIELDVPQCGYCQAGQIMSAAALLAAFPHPPTRYRRGDERQLLPLRHLHADPRGDVTGQPIFGIDAWHLDVAGRLADDAEGFRILQPEGLEVRHRHGGGLGRERAVGQ